MSGPTTQQRALVLRTAASGESFRKIDLLAADDGCRLVLQRSSKKQGGVVPDLFDTAEVALAANKQHTVYFVEDYALLRRRSEIGRSYRTLRAASGFCVLLAENAPLMDDAPALLAIAERALDAFAAKDAPEVTLLKALYLLLRHEGYPVKEHWLAELRPKLRQPVAALLRNPIGDAAPPAERDTAEAAADQLMRWIRQHTDLRATDVG